MQSKWFIRLIIVAGICILLATILRLMTPETVPLQLTETATTSLDGTQTTFEKISYTGAEFKTPATLPVVSVVAQESPATEKLVSAFQLRPVPNVENIWQGDTHSMTLIQQTGFMSLGKNEHESPEDTTPLNPQMAQQKATEFATTYFGNHSLTLLENSTQYAIDDDGRPADATNAQYATYFFSPTVNNYPLKVGSSNQALLSVTIDHDVSIIKAQFFPVLYQVGEPQTKRVISVSDAVSNIEKDKAAVLQVSQAEFRPIDLSRIVSANLTSVSIEYRPDSELRLAYPFYIFSGTAVDAGGAELTVQIATPAVATTSN